MQRTQFVIYGAGNRGKRLFSYLGSEHFVAFIDINEIMQKGVYCGKAVVSMETYRALYKNYYVIQSIDVDSTVGKVLEGNGIYHYSELFRMPGEFAGWGTFDYRIAFGNRFQNKNKVYLFGINAFSLLAAEYCCEKEIDPIIVIKHHDPAIEWVKHNTDYKAIELDMLGKNETLFITEERQLNYVNWDKLERLYDFKPFYNGIYRNEKINRIHLSQNGKKCFIVATGPSLKVEDLKVLKDQGIFSFGLNSIIRINDQWIPDAYVCVDSRFLEQNADEIDQYPVKYKFFSDVNLDFPWNNNDDDDVYCLHCFPTDYDLIPEFESDISLQVSFGATVTYVALQIAVYMGFTEIYLLGVDCNYLMNSRNNHFVEDEKEDKEDHKVDSMLLNYKSAKNYADANGIKIFNATRGGALEVFERVNFDQLFRTEE